ncbi:RING-type domain-containing protein [Heracleum sosnowskyi]|uniref:RING-type domain-containing protein n=1 Tax=Heracleum sosnowskyi TaxID=360622 RepID=A0AAD8MBL5_9APIA|nr:RING-type domain-containing protein [Heracleum sosnowskyi]
MPTPPATTSDHRHHATGDNQKPNLILHSLLIKPIIFLFVLSLFLFLGLAALALLFLLLAGSSVHLFNRRRTTAASNSITPSEIEENLPGFRSDPRSDPVKECASGRVLLRMMSIRCGGLWVFDLKIWAFFNLVSELRDGASLDYLIYEAS